jgi:hypothetical protein
VTQLPVSPGDRPRIVVIAVWLTGAGMILGTLSMLARGVPMPERGSPAVLYAVLAAGEVLVALLLYAIWTGRNWARLLFVATVLLPLLDPELRRAQRDAWRSASGAVLGLWVLQTVLGLVALVALLLPPSHRWFMARRPRYRGELALGFGWLFIAFALGECVWFLAGLARGRPVWGIAVGALVWGAMGYALRRRHARIGALRREGARDEQPA